METLDHMLAEYSVGRLSRRELERASGLWFGDVLSELSRLGLPLPRVDSRIHFNEAQQHLFSTGAVMNIALIVTDAGPLITLAVADALDTLKLLQARVFIPDMVHFEVTRYADKPSAQIFIAWLEANRGMVEIGQTEEFAEFSALLAINPAVRGRNRGELAAAEVLANALQDGLDAGLLLFEDSDIRKANFLVRLPDNVLVLSTSTFLHGLQRRKLIPDAEAILNRATAVRGPAVSIQRALATKGAEDVLNAWPN